MKSTVCLVRSVRDPSGGGPMNGMFALQKGLRELLELEPDQWDWFTIADDPRQADIPWFWCWQDRPAAIDWAMNRGKFIQGPNMLFMSSFQPRCDQHERFLLDTDKSLAMFCHTDWYRDLIRSHLGSKNDGPVLLWPYPIEPLPPVPNLTAAYELLIYAKSGHRPRLVENLQARFPSSRTFIYGQFRRDDFWQAAANSQAAVYLSDDDHGPLSLAELQLTGCPTVGIPRGAPYLEHGVNGILLTEFPQDGKADNETLARWFAAIQQCQQMDRENIRKAALKRFSRAGVARQVLVLVREIVEQHDRTASQTITSTVPVAVKKIASNVPAATKTVSIALVTWPRFRHRREAFAKTVDQIEEFVTASQHQLEIVCSSESAGASPSARSWLTSFCRQRQIRLSWRAGAPDLGSNMNAALNAATGDFILLVQDGVFFNKPVDLSEAADFLDRHHDYALVRFGWVFTQFLAPVPGSKFRQVNMSGPYPYADEPHLRRASFRDEFGMFVEGQGYGGPENTLQQVLRRKGWKIAATQELKCQRDEVPSTAPARWPAGTVDDLADEYSDQRIERAQRSHDYVFVAGLHRSGTTVLTKKIGEHPNVSSLRSTGVPADEGQHLQSVVPTAHQLGGPGRFGFHQEAHITERSPLATDRNAKQLLRSWIPFWDLSCRILLEKSPPNLLRTRLLSALFPSARFIVIVRHPIAVAMSTNSWCGVSFEDALDHWFVCYEMFQRDAPKIASFQLVRYENLVSDASQIMPGVWEFLGLSPTFAPHESRAWSSKNGVHFDRWRQLPRSHRDTIIKKYQNRCENLGYSLLDV